MPPLPVLLEKASIELKKTWIMVVKQLHLLNLRFGGLKKLVVLVVMVQLLSFYFLFQDEFVSHGKTRFASSTLTRFKEHEIEIDSSKVPQIVQRYLSLNHNLFRESLYQNCIDFLEMSNNTEFYDSIKASYHPEMYESNPYNNVLDQIRNRFQNEGKPIESVSDNDDVKPLMDQYKVENRKYETSLFNQMARLRIHGKCFFDNRVNFDTTDYEKNLFPYLSGELPIYEHWNGETVVFPRYYKTKKPRFTLSFLQKLQSDYNGRGIVMSIGEGLIQETYQLIKVLRYLNNTLPIQMVHQNELSEDSKQYLFELCRSEEIKGPKQDLWIVDVGPCLSSRYDGRFRGFNSKWMAVLFSSFDEIILMDNDVVPFINPLKFFTDFPGYLHTGTFFFRDRESFERINTGSLKLIEKMVPSKIENLLFDIENTSSDRLKSKFHLFEYGAKHYMESGVVVLDKRRNFKGLLTSINVQLIGGLTGQFYGDKEIFWLGQVLAGNSDVYFNTHAAGNIGKIEDFSRYLKVIKSIQPAHISPLDDHTLLWVNSGLKVCKKDTAISDFEEIYKPREDSQFQTAQDLELYYNSILPIDGVIIPPNSNRDWNNNIQEPSRGFDQKNNQGCGGYYWFAYSSVGTPNDPPALTNGELVEFTEDEKLYIREIAAIWIN